jgi:hypothetical protein
MDRIQCLKCVVSANVEAGRPYIAPPGKAQTRMLELDLRRCILLAESPCLDTISRSLGLKQGVGVLNSVPQTPKHPLFTPDGVLLVS